MQISEVLSVTAVAIAAGSLAMTIWNIRRTTRREDGRDHADVVLRYTEDSGTLHIDNEGPNAAVQVSLLATGPKLSLQVHSFGLIPPGEVRQYRVSAPTEFFVYLTWRDGRARTHRKKYRLMPGHDGYQGDGWPDLLRQVARPGLARDEALKKLERTGKWQNHSPDLW